MCNDSSKGNRVDRRSLPPKGDTGGVLPKGDTGGVLPAGETGGESFWLASGGLTIIMLLVTLAESSAPIDRMLLSASDSARITRKSNHRSN